MASKNKTRSVLIFAMKYQQYTNLSLQNEHLFLRSPGWKTFWRLIKTINETQRLQWTLFSAKSIIQHRSH